jgi:hypothetical protein
MFGNVVRIGMSMDVKQEEVGIKPPMGPKKGCKAQRKTFIGDALWIGKRGKGPCSTFGVCS